MKCWDNCHLHQ